MQAAVVLLVTAAVVPDWDFNVQPVHHLCYENPDAHELQGETAFQPDCGHQQEKPQQGAEEGQRREEDSDLCEKNRDAFKRLRHLAQQPPWNV